LSPSANSLSLCGEPRTIRSSDSTQAIEIKGYRLHCRALQNHERNSLIPSRSQGPAGETRRLAKIF
jgi:hypothetical protein